jgi:hypothetical protein
VIDVITDPVWTGDGRGWGRGIGGGDGNGWGYGFGGGDSDGIGTSRGFGTGGPR